MDVLAISDTNRNDFQLIFPPAHKVLLIAVFIDIPKSIEMPNKSHFINTTFNRSFSTAVGWFRKRCVKFQYLPNLNLKVFGRFL